MRTTISVPESLTQQDKEKCFLICGSCREEVNPFGEIKRCTCGNLQVDEEKSTDRLLYMKEHQPAQFTVTSEYKPTFKEKIMDILKGKNKV